MLRLRRPGPSVRGWPSLDPPSLGPSSAGRTATAHGAPDLERLRLRLLEAPYTYPDVGHTSGDWIEREDVPAGFRVGRDAVVLGQGSETYAAAVDALLRWEMFRMPGVELSPERPRVAEGTLVLVCARALGLWTVNPCRIVYVLDDTGPARRFGFGYGTLPGHVAAGEERFAIEHTADDRVTYEIASFSRPATWWSRAAQVYLRHAQRRFRRNSLAAMHDAVELALGRGAASG